MARPRKTGLDYFPFDVDFFDDEKMVAIAGEFGLKGEITAVKLLCAVYRNGYFVLWNDTMRKKMMMSLPGISPDLLEQVVNRLVRWDFFDENLFNSVKVLTSKGIQKRYFEAVKRRINKDGLPYLLVNVDINDISARGNGVNVRGNPVNVRGNAQSKVNIKESSTGVEEKKSPSPSSSGSCPVTLDDEVRYMKDDSVWLDQLQVLHHMDVEGLRAKLDEFLLNCKADGMVSHQGGMRDAKSHFNNWLRIVKKQEENEKNRTGREDRRKGNMLKADEQKTYGTSF